MYKCDIFIYVNQESGFHGIVSCSSNHRTWSDKYFWHQISVTGLQCTLYAFFPTYSVSFSMLPSAGWRRVKLLIKLNPGRKSIFSLIAGTSSNIIWLLKSVSHVHLARAVEYASSFVGIFNHLCKAKGRVNENIPRRSVSLGQDNVKPASGLLHLESFILPPFLQSSISV